MKKYFIGSICTSAEAWHLFLKNVSYSTDIYLAASLSIVASLSNRSHYVAKTFYFTGQHFNERKLGVTKSTSYLFYILGIQVFLRGCFDLDGDGCKTAIGKMTSELSWEDPQSKKNGRRDVTPAKTRFFCFYRTLCNVITRRILPKDDRDITHKDCYTNLQIGINFIY